MTNEAALNRGKSNIIMYFILVALLGLIVWAVISVATEAPKTCDWTLCDTPAVIRLQNPSTGRIGYYCAEHGMLQMNKGWISAPKP